MDEDEDRREKAPRRRPRYAKLLILFIVVLVAGLGAGAGVNLLFDEPPVKKGEEASPAEKPVEKEEKEETGGTSGRRKGTAFSTPEAMSHIYFLSESIGERPSGSVKESGAADYVVNKLGEYGYVAEEQPFSTADGFGSRNIIGTRRGAVERYRVVVAAHYDSSRGSQGAIDNASGAGLVLELARVFADVKPQPTVQFVFLGANRPGGGDTADRLVGARTFVEFLGTLKRKEIVGMIAVDSVGTGEVLALRTQGTGLQRLRDKLATFAGEKDIAVTKLKSTDDSDNIPFEDSGIPAVWLQWCGKDGSLETDNRYVSVDAGKVETAGMLIESFIKDLTSDDLEELKY